MARVRVDSTTGGKKYSAAQRAKGRETMGRVYSQMRADGATKGSRKASAVPF